MCSSTSRARCVNVFSSAVEGWCAISPAQRKVIHSTMKCDTQHNEIWYTNESRYIWTEHLLSNNSPALRHCARQCWRGLVCDFSNTTKCDLWMSHVTYERVMSSDLSYKNVKCDYSVMGELSVTCEWVTSHINESCPSICHARACVNVSLNTPF